MLPAHLRISKTKQTQSPYDRNGGEHDDGNDQHQQQRQRQHQQPQAPYSTRHPNRDFASPYPQPSPMPGMRPAPLPALCVTGAMCQQGFCRIITRSNSNTINNDGNQSDYPGRQQQQQQQKDPSSLLSLLPKEEEEEPSSSLLSSSLSLSSPTTGSTSTYPTSNLNGMGGSNGNGSSSSSSSNSSSVTIAYKIFRPRQLKSRDKPPLIVVHGGPSIPSTYLLPLVNIIVDRCIIYYDQYGCGKSSRPKIIVNAPAPAGTPSSLMEGGGSNSPSGSSYGGGTHHPNRYEPFDISTHVDHLHYLITKEWKLEYFHLYGHSFGGILCYEYLMKMMKTSQRGADGGCLSLVLASTPTSIPMLELEMERLKKELQVSSASSSSNNDGNASLAKNGGGGDDDFSDEDEEYYYKNNYNYSDRNHPSSLISSLSISSQTTALGASGGGAIGGGMGYGGGGGVGGLQSQQQRLNKKSSRSSSGSRSQKSKETLFFETHHCRVYDPLPLVLQDALAQGGPIPWRGIDAIRNYKALKTALPHGDDIDNNQDQQEDVDQQYLAEKQSPPSTRLVYSSSSTFPPTLLMYGEHDFVTRKCMEDWYNVLHHIRQQSNPSQGVVQEASSDEGTTIQDLVMVPNCSHYGMLEDEHVYGNIIYKYIQSKDSG